MIHINNHKNTSKNPTMKTFTDSEQKCYTSKSFITGTGLKKCRPPNLSFLSVTSAILPIGRDEVLDAKMVCSGAAWNK